MRICDEKKRLLAKIYHSAGRMYVLDITIAHPVCLAACAGEDAWRWHARFGHINFEALRKMRREGLVRSLPILSQVDKVCEACLIGMHRRTSFPHQMMRRAMEPLELVHGDIFGPISPVTPTRNRYFLLLIDDYNRYMWMVLLPTKDGAAATIKNVQEAAERKSGKQLRALRTDREGKFTANHFKEYLAELGVQRQLTVPYSPAQNSVIERRNQTVVGVARYMLKAKGLPGTFWGEAVATVVYILNKSMSNGVGGKMPNELWTGSTPSMQHLPTFGCTAHVKNMWPHMPKLEDRSKPMIFVGYEASSIAYRAYDLAMKHVQITRDVVFDEEGQWRRDGDKIDSEFIIEYVGAGRLEVVITCHGEWAASPAPEVGAASARFALPAGEQVPPRPAATQVSPPADMEMGLDADHDSEEPLRF
jgi:hypothetical protein